MQRLKVCGEDNSHVYYLATLGLERLISKLAEFEFLYK